MQTKAAQAAGSGVANRVCESNLVARSRACSSKLVPRVNEQQGILRSRTIVIRCQYMGNEHNCEQQSSLVLDIYYTEFFCAPPCYSHKQQALHRGYNHAIVLLKPGKMQS